MILDCGGLTPRYYGLVSLTNTTQFLHTKATIIAYVASSRDQPKRRQAAALQSDSGGRLRIGSGRCDHGLHRLTMWCSMADLEGSG